MIIIVIIIVIVDTATIIITHIVIVVAKLHIVVLYRLFYLVQQSTLHNIKNSSKNLVGCRTIG